MKFRIVLSMVLLLGCVGGSTLHASDSLSIYSPPVQGVYGKDYAAGYHDPDQWNLFTAKEFFTDFFYAAADFRGEDVSQGGGVGIGYFFNRYLGWTFEGMALDDGPTDMILFTGGLLRLPIDYAAVAFYGMAGPGYQGGDVEEWNLQVGGGFDLRLLDRVSSYFDARYVEPEDGEAGSVFRAGVRILF